MNGWLETQWGAALGLALAVACSAGGAERSRVSGGAGGNTGGDGGSPGGGPGTGGSGPGTGGTTSLDAGPIGGSGGSDVGDGACDSFSQEAKTALQPADIIWAVDTSCSMFEEAVAVQQNINAFSQQIIASGIDVRVVLIEATGGVPFILPIDVCVPPPLGSGQCGNGSDSKAPAFQHVWAYVASENGLNVMYDTFPNYRNMLRVGAAKHLVIITDDNSTTAPHVTADGFIQAYTALDPALFTDSTSGTPNWKMSGIYAFTACPNAASPGVIWGDLINRTGGIAGDICACPATGDQAACSRAFQAVFNELATRIVTGSQALECQWGIPEAPAGESFDPEKVNVEFIDMDNGTKESIYKATDANACDPVLGGWYYNDNLAPTQVIACPASCDKIKGVLQGKIDILFGCKSEPLPPPT